jgi:hypothetical protein
MFKYLKNLRLVKMMRMKGLPRFMHEFCMRLVTDTVEEREKNNVVRKDLMQYLIQLRNNNEDGIIDKDEWTVKKSGRHSLNLNRSASH